MTTTHPFALTQEFLRGFGTRWEAAWNSHDTERVLELFDDDIVWDDTVFWPKVIEGIGSMRAYVDTIWKVMPDVHFEEVQLFTAPEDGRAMYLFRQSGTAPKRYGQGRFQTYGCDIFLRFRGEKLVDYLAQYEITEMMRQYGALPPRGDLVGGSYLLSLMQHDDQ